MKLSNETQKAIAILKEELNQIISKKKEFVLNQKYQKASEMRDLEKELLAQLNEVINLKPNLKENPIIEPPLKFEKWEFSIDFINVQEELPFKILMGDKNELLKIRRKSDDLIIEANSGKVHEFIIDNIKYLFEIKSMFLEGNRIHIKTKKGKLSTFTLDENGFEKINETHLVTKDNVKLKVGDKAHLLVESTKGKHFQVKTITLEDFIEMQDKTFYSSFIELQKDYLVTSNGNLVAIG